jgi:hypothetical protein
MFTEISKECTPSVFFPEDVIITFFRNIGKYPPDYTALDPRRQQFS